MTAASRWAVRLAVTAFGMMLATYALAADPTIAGIWKQVDPSTGFVGGLIYFRETNRLWDGFLVKIYPKPGDPVDPVCTACTDDRKDQPVLGMRLLQSSKRNGLVYDGGTVLDPRDGSQYNVELTLTPDDQTLYVRGYVGITLFGETLEWKRLTDDERAKLDADHVKLAMPPDHPKPTKKKPADKLLHDTKDKKEGT